MGKTQVTPTMPATPPLINLAGRLFGGQGVTCNCRKSWVGPVGAAADAESKQESGFIPNLLLLGHRSRSWREWKQEDGGGRGRVGWRSLRDTEKPRVIYIEASEATLLSSHSQQSQPRTGTRIRQQWPVSICPLWVKWIQSRNVIKQTPNF